MIKKCVVLNGKVINIGEWDYQKQKVLVSPPEYDKDGKLIKEAVYEDKIMNPLPEGATVEERDFEYDTNYGWYEVGTEVKYEIVELKKQLAETDYKIIKCYEYQLAGLELPYDIQTLHTERQVLRDRINELEVGLDA